MKLRVTPGGALRGELRVAADKSISHRAIMLSAIASGHSRLYNLLEGEDVLATMAALRRMGVVVRRGRFGGHVIHGVGLHGLRVPRGVLDMGNSGTAMRLFAGLLCAQPWHCVLSGDASLRTRPMGRILRPLRRMGACMTAVAGRAPLRLYGGGPLRGIRYAMPMASAQVKSAILLAGLYAHGATTVVEPKITRDHTERMLRHLGARITRRGHTITVHPAVALRPRNVVVPGDLSAAAFFLVAASIMPGSDVWLRGVGVNPSRTGVITLLRRMGADVQLHPIGTTNAAEPVADIRVRSAALHGCRMGGDDIALAIDEIPALAMAAACAQGVTEIRDAAELRVKESDRLAALAAGLSALGVAVTEHPDGLTIHGGAVQGGRVDSRADHRIAMAFAVLGGAAQAAVEVEDCDNIATSFPDFPEVARRAGLDVHAV